jgi:hypothetical protein
MTPSQAPFIALSILGNVLFMPQTKFIDSLLDVCIATLFPHGLSAVTEAEPQICQVGKSEVCHMNILEQLFPH